MKKNLSTVFAVFCFAVLLFCLGITTVGSASSSTLYGRVLRLRVLANSDSDEDIELKYKVRDGLLAVTGNLFGSCENVEQALCAANKNKQLLEDTAQRVLYDNGSDKKVHLVIGKENYPEKTYGSLTFPKGEYLSLRVIIGEGNGQNWWCVLFPPLCNAGIEEGGRVLTSYGIDEDEVRKLEKEENENSVEIFGCRIKLKIFDYFG